MNEKPPEGASHSAASEFGLNGCNVGLDQLERIWRLAREGFPDDAMFSVKLTRVNSGISASVTGRDIPSALDEIRQTTVAGDPSHADELMLHVSSELTPSFPSRYIMILINKELIWVEVAGEEPGWVRGRIGGLKDLFADTKARRSFEQATLVFAVAGVIIGAITGTLIAVNASNGSINAGVLIVTGTTIAIGSAGGVLGRLFQRRGRVELQLVDPMPRRQIDKANFALIAISILGVLVTVLSALLAHSDALRHP